MRILKFRKYILFTMLIIILSAVLTLTCFDATRDNPFDPVNANKILYVHPSGNDNNSGTADKPKATIKAALDAANAGYKIYVASSTYTNTIDTLNVSGVELLGGFPINSWDVTQRNPSSNQTIINDSRSGGTTFDPIATVRLIQSSPQNMSVIDGFTINSSIMGYSCAIKLMTTSADSFQCRISNNIINGNSSNSFATTYGIFYYNDSVSGGTGTITIARNSIDGGDAQAAAGITSSNGIYLRNNISNTINVNIWNNTINGGTSLSTTTDANSYGIYCHEISPNIFNNTIYMGNSSGAGVIASYGIYLEADLSVMIGSRPIIINNIIFGDLTNTEYGIYEVDNPSDPNAVENNDVYNCNTALYHDFELDDMSSLTAGGNYLNGSYLITPTGANNINQLASFVNQAAGNWHLVLPDPENEIIRVSGKRLNEFTIDKDGNTRTVPWSIGAYEHD